MVRTEGADEWYGRTVRTGGAVRRCGRMARADGGERRCGREVRARRLEYRQVTSVAPPPLPVARCQPCRCRPGPTRASTVDRATPAAALRCDRQRAVTSAAVRLCPELI